MTPDSSQCSVDDCGGQADDDAFISTLTRRDDSVTPQFTESNGLRFPRIDARLQLGEVDVVNRLGVCSFVQVHRGRLTVGCDGDDRPNRESGSVDLLTQLIAVEGRDELGGLPHLVIELSDHEGANAEDARRAERDSRYTRQRN